MTAYRRTGTTDYDKVYNKGLDNEVKVLTFLADLGTFDQIVVCDAIEDQVADIDLILDGIPTSIKCMHEGEKWGNTYFELVTQRYQPKRLESFEHDRLNGWLKGRLGHLHFTDPSWFAGWFFSGKAQQYLIWQGETLRLYSKADIEDFLTVNGFLKVLPLSYKVLQTQGGKNTVCGFVNTAELPALKTWTMKDKTKVAYRPLAA